MQWRDIPGFECFYQVSDTGLIRSWSTWRLLKSRPNWDGSHLVNLSYNGVHHTRVVHRLVAQVFVEQPVGKNVVKHKDGNKDNNSADNLYWSHCKKHIKGESVVI